MREGSRAVCVEGVGCRCPWETQGEEKEEQIEKKRESRGVVAPGRRGLREERDSRISLGDEEALEGPGGCWVREGEKETLSPSCLRTGQRPRRLGVFVVVKAPIRARHNEEISSMALESIEIGGQTQHRT